MGTDLLNNPKAKVLFRYGGAVVAAALALLLRLALDAVLGQEHQPYLVLYIAVAVVVWLAGWRPALVTLVLGLLVCVWLIVPPRDTFAIRGIHDVVDILVCLLVTVTFILLTLLAQLSQAAKRQSEQARLQLAEAHQILELRVKERTAELTEAINDLQHFSYALVHDMRAPLRAMRSYAELLLPEQQRETSQKFCRRIIDSADRMDNLIRDSLNYTRIAYQHLPKVPIDLQAFLLGLIESYPNLELHKSRITILRELPRVQGNHAMLTHCFSNLLNNALKFVPPGEEPRVTIHAEKKNGAVRIWIEDNGTGIHPKDHKRIFDMFQQVHKGYQGTGIGLAIVRKAVERMGGQVGVESEPGKGSRFWVQLDAAL